MDSRNARILSMLKAANQNPMEMPKDKTYPGHESRSNSKNMDLKIKHSEPHLEKTTQFESEGIWFPVHFEYDNYFMMVEPDVLAMLRNEYPNQNINLTTETIQEAVPITPGSEEADNDDCSNVSQSSSSKSCRSSSSISSSRSSSPRESTADDTDADPNYSFSGDSEFSTDEHEVCATQKRSRKRRANPNEWKSNVAKKRRNLGESYISKNSKKIMLERKMRPGCDTTCSYKCVSKITEEQRFQIFRKYWSYGDVNKQRDFISRSLHEIKSRRSQQLKVSSGRSENVAYYFTINGSKIRVCRKYFMATLNISTTTISTVRRKLAHGTLEGDNRGKHGKHRKLPESIKNDVRNHINSIPKIPSHYLRAQTDREYIEGGRTIAQIYRDYVEKCKQEGKPYAGRTSFFDIFNEFNISFFIPKKDQCELCTAYENSDKKEKNQEHEDHLKEKELSRKEKEKDKSDSDPSTIVCTYDLQAALPTPRGEVSVFYYKSKLSTYNLTIYELKTKQGFCYVWHEGEGHRGVIEIATCVFQYIEQKAKATSEDINFIFYTDNCGGQQKNKYMLMMYMYVLCVFRNIKTIQHKFLIKGHTQNEGDTVHSVIEKEIKRTLKSGNIYTPSQYYQIMRTAKKQAPFYVVNELSHSEFIDFKALSHEFGGNFTTNKKNETFSFGDIKILKFTRENPFTFYYKTSYQAEDFDIVDTFQTTGKRNTRGSAAITEEERIDKMREWTVQKAYNTPIPIAANKKRDLMYLVENNYIKKTYFEFYNSLKSC